MSYYQHLPLLYSAAKDGRAEIVTDGRTFSTPFLYALIKHEFESEKISLAQLKEQASNLEPYAELLMTDASLFKDIMRMRPFTASARDHQLLDRLSDSQALEAFRMNMNAYPIENDDLLAFTKAAIKTAKYATADMFITSLKEKGVDPKQQLGDVSLEIVSGAIKADSMSESRQQQLLDVMAQVTWQFDAEIRGVPLTQHFEKLKAFDIVSVCQNEMSTQIAERAGLNDESANDNLGQRANVRGAL